MTRSGPTMGIYGALLAVLHVTAIIHTGISCTIRIDKDKDFVLIGESAELNCSSSCQDLFWETRLAKKSTKNSDFHSTVQVQVNDWENSPVRCLGESDNGTMYQEVTTVTPYALPSAVDIDLETELEEDREPEVTCHVYGVAPVRLVNLSVTRGGEIFLSKTYEEDTTRGPQNLTATFQFTAGRGDNLENFACRVTLNLTEVTSTTVSSAPVFVRTYALPENPRITAPEWIEHGTLTSISCELHDGFPPENITTTLSIEGSPNTEVKGNIKVVSTLDTDDLLPARHHVLCTSEVNGVSKQSNKSVIIYDSPNVTLSLSRNVVSLDDAVTVNCALSRGEARYFGLSVSVDGAEVKRVNSSELTANITITRREPNIFISCQIFILENQRVLQTSGETLTVLYPPEFSDLSCPRSLVLVEGHKSSFGCRSDGNPTPNVWCTPDTLQSSAPLIPWRNMSGVYTCRASNSLGNVSRSVEVAVQYPPDPPTLNISSSSVSPGGSITVTCHSEALPAPTYHWVTPPQARVNVSHDGRSIIIREASLCHNGTFTCQVRNQHGQSSAQQDLQVKSIDNGDPTRLWIVLLCIGVIVGAAVIVLLIALPRQQRRRRGLYDVSGQNGCRFIPMQLLRRPAMNGIPQNTDHEQEGSDTAGSD